MSRLGRLLPLTPPSLALVVAIVGTGCPERRGARARADLPAAPPDRPTPARVEHRAARLRMVASQIESRGVKDRRVLAAMRRVERHLFVPAARAGQAYADHPLPIGEGQTISQPYVVAYMTEALRLGRGARVLEIGTGSGYQAAVLAELVKKVYSVEIVPTLGKRAAKLLSRLGYRNVAVKVGDGYAGWPEHAPFDAVILTAAPPRIPKPLLAQLRVGGVLVAPVGRSWGPQQLVRITRTGKQSYRRERLLGVRFVPMTGEAQKVPR